MARTRANGLFPGLKGRIGNLVLVPYGDELILREAPRGVGPRAAAQVAAQERQSRAARLWKGLPPEAVALWGAYAASAVLPPREDGSPASRRPMNVFGSLAMRYQLVHGPVAPPATPPAAAFLGDAIALVADATPEGLRVRADGANAAGAVTQILVQPLKGGNRRTYRGKYVHARVVAFTPDAREVTIPMETPWVAVAYRFIRADTGQATALAEIGVVRTG